MALDGFTVDVAMGVFKFTSLEFTEPLNLWVSVCL